MSLYVGGKSLHAWYEIITPIGIHALPTGRFGADIKTQGKIYYNLG